MKNKLVVDTKLSLIDYFNIVDELVLEYFDLEGNYQPHMGYTNAIRIFYNNCVSDSNLEGVVSHNFTNITDVDTIANDSGIMSAFEEALFEQKAGFTFANAFNAALDIVEYKKSSVANIADRIEALFGDIAEKLKGVISREDLDKIGEVVALYGNSGINADAVMEAYGKSEKFARDAEENGKQTEGV